jgi:hypothetical protein
VNHSSLTATFILYRRHIHNYSHTTTAMSLRRRLQRQQQTNALIFNLFFEGDDAMRFRK